MISRANIILTHNCNLRCLHCYIDAKANSENQESIFISAKKIIDQLHKDKVKNVMFTGGECMLFKPLIELINYAKNYEMTVSIFTNGMIFNKEVFDLVDAVNISLDGPKEIHNHIRQNKFSYENVVKVLDYLKEIDKYTTIQMTINNLNINDLEFLSPLLMQHLNVRTVKLVFTSSDGRAIENNIVHDLTHIDKVYDRLDNLYENTKYHIQFIPSVINKYDFENYYLSGVLDFALWLDIPKNNYYFIRDEYMPNHTLDNFNINEANRCNNAIKQIILDNKDFIIKDKYINLEKTLSELIKGEL